MSITSSPLHDCTLGDVQLAADGDTLGLGPVSAAVVVAADEVLRRQTTTHSAAAVVAAAAIAGFDGDH